MKQIDELIEKYGYFTNNTKFNTFSLNYEVLQDLIKIKDQLQGYVSPEQHKKDLIEAMNVMQRDCINIANNVLVKSGSVPIFEFNEDGASEYYTQNHEQ
jgi:hypothetical protein